MLKCSLIISFYNRIDYLRLVFASIERQKFDDFEVIIADDGSREEVVKDVNEKLKTVSFPTKYVWHEDRGFRKNKILNKAVVQAESPYLMFIDGDCVLHREFIREHFNYRAKQVCLTGRRVHLSFKLSRILTPEKVLSGYLEHKRWKLIYDSIWGKSTYIEKGWYFSNQFLRKLINSKKRGILGSNFSLYKNDLLKINGFDERYELPSVGEDTDIEYRLLLNGVTIRSLNNIAIKYHLSHPKQSHPVKNIELFNRIKVLHVVYTPFGIRKESTEL